MSDFVARVLTTAVISVCVGVSYIIQDQSDPAIKTVFATIGVTICALNIGVFIATLGDKPAQNKKQ